MELRSEPTEKIPRGGAIYRQQGSRRRRPTHDEAALIGRAVRRNNVEVPASSELNPEQRAAVEHGEDPLLVIAGPGSGKTRVITERIVHLIDRGSAQPGSILALTYTEKAAAEMNQRVRRALPDLEVYPFIGTFHSFCFRTLADHS